MSASCTWCLNGARKTDVPGGNVALFACAREHMHARPLCDDCADKACDYHTGFYCRECSAAGEDEDDAVCYITLVCSRPTWMQLLDEGVVRFARAASSVPGGQ